MKGKIFNAQEVQAIIAGNKTQFREVIKVQPTNENQVFSTVASSIRNKDIGTHNFINPKATWEQTKKFKCPYQVGQKIFVKEKFARSFDNEGNPIITLEADSKQERKWKPAQHMKQEHSRITLEIIDVKVERLADISEDDAIREGVNKLFTEEEMKHVLKVHKIEKNDSYTNYLWHGHIGRTITKKQSDEWEYQCSAYKKAKDSFFSLWNATHRKPKEKFEANPFVWVVDFKINK